MAAGPYNVPDVPGVPAINFAAGSEAGIELLSADTISINGPSQWGIFSDGTAVVTADSVADFTFKKEFALSDYLVEEGAFETYDKVMIPFDCRIRFAAGGSSSNRQALLDSIDAISGDLNLYDAVTPEATYTSCNVTHYDYRRTSTNGVGLIIVDVWLLQVRVVSGSGTGTGNTAQPSGADAQNDGTVQTTEPTSTQENTVSSGNFSLGYAP
jgi:hypothetical protein